MRTVEFGSVQGDDGKTTLAYLIADADFDSLVAKLRASFGGIEGGLTIRKEINTADEERIRREIAETEERHRLGVVTYRPSGRKILPRKTLTAEDENV